MLDFLLQFGCHHLCELRSCSNQARCWRVWVRLSLLVQMWVLMLLVVLTVVLGVDLGVEEEEKEVVSKRWTHTMLRATPGWILTLINTWSPEQNLTETEDTGRDIRTGNTESAA